MTKILLTITCVLSLIGCGQGSSISNTWNPPKLYTYGDSITQGTVTGNVSYANYVAQALGYQLICHAVGGTAIGQQAQVIKNDTGIWTSKDIIIFTPGFNDALLNGDSENYEKYYKTVLSTTLNILVNSPAKVYLGTAINPLPNAYVSLSTVDEYADTTYLVGQSFPQLTVIDFNNLYKPTQALTVDFIHPNLSGQQVLANIFLTGRR